MSFALTRKLCILGSVESVFLLLLGVIVLLLSCSEVFGVIVLLLVVYVLVFAFLCCCANICTALLRASYLHVVYITLAN